jgi:hypothetical protein
MMLAAARYSLVAFGHVEQRAPSSVVLQQCLRRILNHTEYWNTMMDHQLPVETVPGADPFGALTLMNC